MYDDIGLFWYIDDMDMFIYEKFNLKDEINNSALFVTAPMSHPILWEQHRKNYDNVKFTHYPRGRVNYQVPKKKFELDMDPCLHSDEIIDKICKIFLLDKRKIVIIPVNESNANSANYSREGHYSCHLCRKKE